jgi:hypothetical protein
MTMHTETYRDSKITILDAQAGEAREGWQAGRYLVLIASPDGIDRGLSGDDLAVLVSAAKQGIDHQLQRAARKPESQTPCCGARWRYGPIRIQPSLTDFHCARCGLPANRVFSDTGEQLFDPATK